MLDIGFYIRKKKILSILIFGVISNFQELRKNMFCHMITKR